MVAALVLAAWSSVVPVGDLDALLSQVRVGSERADFTALRMAWAASPSYDPYLHDDPEFRKCLEALVTGIETRDLHTATRACERDFDRYFQDIRWNLRCADAYALAGNDERAEFHRYVHGGLVRSVLASGDGETPGTAYHVVTITEQYAVLAVRHARRGEQETVERDGHRRES